jgi:hypothetical protein
MLTEEEGWVGWLVAMSWMLARIGAVYFFFPAEDYHSRLPPSLVLSCDIPLCYHNWM